VSDLATSKPTHCIMYGGKVLVLATNDCGGSFFLGKGKPIHRIEFSQGARYTWWVMQKDGEI